MILYTSMPEELIFQPDEKVFQNRMTLQVGGCSLLVEKTTEAQFRVVQVLSSDPSHYLMEAYTPGQILSNLS
ncbi:YlzJ-like family protein [Aureibacillus halotolerans]|uniref:YlzJ-like protein n=1 Tax=Aureibacillus halotolerans TaxID=1508390 RepID=A0A4R6U4J5_9BACI|nr:YlzJ-like family protein [Aureibacillus halotolerans]TDQ39703.1 YlzJ-like protein [Aureibacillus halotolerans]